MNDLLSKYGFDEWRKNVVSCENRCQERLARDSEGDKFGFPPFTFLDFVSIYGR